jgi:hypothetical protein
MLKETLLQNSAEVKTHPEDNFEGGDDDNFKKEKVSILEADSFTVLEGLSMIFQ